MPVLSFVGTVAPATTVTRQHMFPAAMVLEALEIDFLVGQGGWLHVTASIVRVGGQVDALLWPDPEVTGDDAIIEALAEPVMFGPGTALQLRFRNAGALQTRRYMVRARFRVPGEVPE